MSQDARAKFGKHKGKTRAWIQQNDWRYLEWAKLNVPNLFETGVRSEETFRRPEAPAIRPGSWREKDPPPEGDPEDVNSSGFLYNIAKRMLDNGEL